LGECLCRWLCAGLLPVACEDGRWIVEERHCAAAAPGVCVANRRNAAQQGAPFMLSERGRQSLSQ